MKKAIDRFFLSDKVLYTIPWIFAAVLIVLQIFYYFDYPDFFNIFSLGTDILNVCLVFGIAVSYKAHEKNIMKTLFGSIIVGRIIYLFYYVTAYFEITEFVPDKIFPILLIIFYILFFINHLILGYGHKANPDRVSINRVVCLMIIITFTVWNFATMNSVVVGLLYIAYDTLMIIEILCIETKVDAYKIIRENK